MDLTTTATTAALTDANSTTRVTPGGSDHIDNDETKPTATNTKQDRPRPHHIESLRLFQSLPITTWSEIISYLLLSEGRYLCQTCHHLWNLSSVFEAHRHCIDITKATTMSTTTNAVNPASIELRYLMYPPIYSNLNSLVVLNLSNLATNKILFTLQNQLPNLQELYMIGSGNSATFPSSRCDSDLSDMGLLSLMMAENPVSTFNLIPSKQRIRSGRLDTARCRTLRYIDITECSSISFYATILLREKLLHPELIIRRIPKWMEGHYDTMFPDDGIHTYYADGTFLFNRSSSNCGYVCDLWKWPLQPQQPSSPSSSCSSSSTTTNATTTADSSPQSCAGDDHSSYGECLRFINCEAPQHLRWSYLFDDLYYPGVTISRFYSDETADDSHADVQAPMTPTKSVDDNSVIVVQNTNGVVLPTQSYRCPIFRNAPNSVLQLGKSMYRDVDGNILSANTFRAVFRVTRMQKFLLNDEVYSNISSKGNLPDLDLHRSSHQRNSSMPSDHIIAAIQISEEERMSTNIIVGSNDPYWNDDRALKSAVGQIDRAFFQHQPITESSDQYIRMIRRQKRMLYL